MTKTLEVPWLVGDDCWVLCPVPTWTKPVTRPDCKGRKTITTCTTTYYTCWSRVSSIRIEMFWHGTSNWLVGTIPLFPREGGKPEMGHSDATSRRPEEVFATEDEAIAYATKKKLTWHPATQGKRP